MKILRLFLVFLSVGSLLLVLESSRERRAGTAVREQLAQTLENVVERVRAADENTQAALNLLDMASLSKARTLALLIETDPSVLADQARLEQVCRTLDMDELSVSDGTGTLVAAVPPVHVGFCLGSGPQAAEFLPAITNRSFEFVQAPQVRSEDGKFFQYVGVARRDSPGVVQAGIEVGRRQVFRQLASADDIVRTSRVQRGGSVRIEAEEGTGREGWGTGAREEAGQLVLCKVCGGRRVTVFAPAPSGFLGNRAIFVFLASVAGLLFLAAVRAMVPDFRKVTRVQKRACLLFVCAMAAIGLAFESVRERAVVAVAREQLLLTLENATARVRSALDNVKMTTDITRRSNLVKARSYALLAEAAPARLTDTQWLETARRAFDADAVFVSDEKGVIVTAVPSSQQGYSLASHPASAAFMPAVTNKSFEFVKGPFARGFDGKVFQYAGVARPDCPGVLAVGFSAARLALIQSLAGLGSIDKTSSGDGDCFVEVKPLVADQSLPHGYFTADRKGRRHLCLATPCDDRLVTVGLPDPAGLLASPVVSGALALLVFLLLVGMCGALAPDAVAAFRDGLKTFGQFFWGLHAEKTRLKVGRRRASLRQLVTNPIVLVWIVAYVLCAVFIWSIRTKEARDAARDLLLERSANALSEVSGSVDNMLFAIARAMVRHYRTPDSLTRRDAADLAHRYDVDEVDIVNAQGVAFVNNFGSTEPFVMASSPEPAKFNCLLQGVQAYSQPFRAAAGTRDVIRKYAGVPFPDAPGYVQIGIDRSRLTSDLRYLLEDNVRARNVGKGGFILWADDRTGEIIANGARECSPDDTLAGIGFNSATAPEEGTAFLAEFYGRTCLVVWRRYANLRLYAALPCGEISALGKSIPPWIVMTLMVIGFVKLSTRLGDLVAQLKSFILAEKDRQLKDLTLAKTIQTSALPVGFPNERVFKIFAKMKAAREVGGDFYDFYPRPDGNLVFLVADVSGKGVPAALFMMRAKAIIRAAVFEHPDSISAAIRLANDNLAEHNDAEMFVTAWIGVYHLDTGVIAYVSAGHNPPIIRRADGSVEWVRGRGGLPLAAMEGAAYRSGRCRLGPGDSLFLYTDGVTEAINPAEEQYGEARLEAVMRHVGKDFVREVGGDVAAFMSGAEQFDDITMLSLDIPPRPDVI